MDMKSYALGVCIGAGVVWAMWRASITSDEIARIRAELWNIKVGLGTAVPAASVLED